MAARSPLSPLATASLAALCGLVLAACRSTTSSSGVPELPEAFQEGPLEERPSDDRSVEASLAQIIRSSNVIEGHRVVELELCNQSSEALSFAYSAEWLDRAGERVIDLEAAWTPLALAAGERRAVQLRAPSPQADSWILMATALPAE